MCRAILLWIHCMIFDLMSTFMGLIVKYVEFFVRLLSLSLSLSVCVGFVVWFLTSVCLSAQPNEELLY